MNLNLLPLLFQTEKTLGKFPNLSPVYMLKIFELNKRLVIHNQSFRFCRLIVKKRFAGLRNFSPGRACFCCVRFVSPDQPPLVMGGALPKPAFGQVSPTMPPTWGDSQQLKPVKLDDLMRGWDMYMYVYIYIYIYVVMYVYIYICKFIYRIIELIAFNIYIYTYVPSWERTVSLPTTFFKMIFLCKRWDMLVPWRV